MTYPYDRPFVMAETVSGIALCVVLVGGRVVFHNADASDAFPGPVVTEYEAATFIANPADPMSALALRLGNNDMTINAETFGALRSWVASEAR